MRRLLPPFISCRSQRQKEETAHAQAIGASFKLSNSAPERTDGAPLSPPLVGCYSNRPKEETSQTDSVRGSENRRRMCVLLPLDKAWRS
jgi:hypothetical protein